MKAGRGRLAAVLGLVLVLVAGEVLVVHAAVQAPGVIGNGYHILGELLAAGVLGGGAALLLLRLPRRSAVLVLLALGVLVRLAALSPKAPLSNDLYRYAWDGRVQAQGIDPYRYPPDAAALRGLRDPSWLWPSGRPTLINRPEVRTIYPPAAQAEFLALHALGVARLHDLGYELVGLVLDLAVLAVVLALLYATGRDPRLAGWYALSPFPAMEAVANGHVDVTASLVILAGLALARRHRAGAATVLITLAALIKLYPGLLLVVTLRAARSGRRLLAAVLAGLALSAVAYLPHVLDVGVRVLGYLPGYLREEHYTVGTRYLLVGLAGLTGTAGSAVVAMLVLATAGWVLWRAPDPLVGATWLLGVLLLAVTPVQTWYALPLVAVAVCAGRPEWLAVAMAGYPLYITTLLNGPALLAGRLAYLAAALCVVITSFVRYRRTGGRSGERSGERRDGRRGARANSFTPAVNAVPGR